MFWSSEVFGVIYILTAVNSICSEILIKITSKITGLAPVKLLFTVIGVVIAITSTKI
jgi:hypothetical protein